jgi:hypothetical protein
MEPVTAPAAHGVLVSEWKTERSRSRYAPAPQPMIRIVTPDKKDPLPDDASSGLVILGGPALAIYDATGPAIPDKAVPAAGLGRHLAYLLNTPVHSSPGENARKAAAAWLQSAGEKPRIIVWLLEDRDFQP